MIESRSRRLRHVQEGTSRNACVTQFGSGWGWLVAEGGKLKIIEDAQRRAAVLKGADAAADDRRLGARVLPRLPEPPARSRQRCDRQAAELGLRRGKPGDAPDRRASSSASGGRLRPFASRALQSRRERCLVRCLRGDDNRFLLPTAYRVRWRSSASRRPRSAQPPKPAERGGEARARTSYRRASSRRRRRTARPAKPRRARAARRDQPARREHHRLVDGAQGDRGRAGESRACARCSRTPRCCSPTARTPRRASCSSRASQTDPDTKLSPLAWLALFDLHAARERPRRVRPARHAVRAAVRALGAVVGRARCKPPAGRPGRRRLHRRSPASCRAAVRRSSKG